MSHDHHHHASGTRDFGPAFAAGTALNLALTVVQLIYGIAANSMALIADAGHNFGDVLGLVLAWGAYTLCSRRPSPTFTYGLRGASILAALFNAVILLVATGAIVLEAIRRIGAPGEVASVTMMVVAGIGIVINALSAWLLSGGPRQDINIRGAVLHLIADALVSVGVVVAGAAILLTGWTWIDPAVSLVIAVVIVWGTAGLLREAVRLSLGAVPPDIDPTEVRGFLESRPGVVSLHDLHIWAMSTTETALTCHLVMPRGHPGDTFIAEICQSLEHDYAIGHATLQIELGDAKSCRFEPEHVV